MGHIAGAFPLLHHFAGVATCCADSSRLRPILTPRATAAALPAFIRSCKSDRSSSARMPTICHMARPVGVSVSIASATRLESHALSLQIIQQGYKVTQRPAQPVKLPDRSTSPALRAFRHFANAGRLAFEPVAVSVNILSHPAPFRAVSCKQPPTRNE